MQKMLYCQQRDTTRTRSHANRKRHPLSTVFQAGRKQILSLMCYFTLPPPVPVLFVIHYTRGDDRRVTGIIRTEKPDEINDALVAAFECGTTKIAAKGGYSNSEKSIIYFVVNRFRISRMRDIIHTIDPKAFVTISEVADVFKAND